MPRNSLTGLALGVILTTLAIALAVPPLIVAVIVLTVSGVLWAASASDPHRPLWLSFNVGFLIVIGVLSLFGVPFYG